MFLSRSRFIFSLARPNLALRSLHSVTGEDVAHFASFLSPSSIISSLAPSHASPNDLSPYNNDWMGKYHGQASTVLRPKTTEQVSQIVKYCNDKGIGIVPQGGNTGLVGGGVPISNELVLSLANLNSVRSFDAVSGHFSYL